MDDSRIQQIRSKVLSELRRSPDPVAAEDLESRVAALEAAVADLQVRPPAISRPHGMISHPSLQVLHVGGGTDRCLMEPDKPCVQSHACRTFGH